MNDRWSCEGTHTIRYYASYVRNSTKKHTTKRKLMIFLIYVILISEMDEYRKNTNVSAGETSFDINTSVAHFNETFKLFSIYLKYELFFRHRTTVEQIN